MTSAERYPNLSAGTYIELETNDVGPTKVGVFDLRHPLDALSSQIPPGFYFSIPGPREQYITNPGLLNPYLEYFQIVALENYYQGTKLGGHTWLFVPSVEIITPGNNTTITLVEVVPVSHHSPNYTI